MAIVHVTLVSVRTLNRGLPVADSVPKAAETLTSSGSSQQAALAAGNTEQIWRVTPIGGHVWVAFGPNPTAAAGDGHLVPNGQPIHFLVSAAGEKIAIKDV